jgi:hypothetical protein
MTPSWLTLKDFLTSLEHKNKVVNHGPDKEGQSYGLIGF